MSNQSSGPVTPGNAAWRSDIPEINALTGNRPVMYIEGMLDLRPWCVFEFPCDALSGTREDFARADHYLATAAPQLGFKSAYDVEKWRRRIGMSWRYRNCCTVLELVPFMLNSKLMHSSGAAVIHKERPSRTPRPPQPAQPKTREEYNLERLNDYDPAKHRARIARLESLAGRGLPEDYRQFLLEMAPCGFSTRVAYRPLEVSPWTSDGLNPAGLFFGLEEGAVWDIIRNWEIDTSSEIIPAHMLTISVDSGGNNILLALDDPAGRIYFQDKDTGDFYLCARTFGEFLDSCERDHCHDHYDTT